MVQLRIERDKNQQAGTSFSNFAAHQLRAGNESAQVSQARESSCAGLIRLMGLTFDTPGPIDSLGESASKF